MKVKDQIIYVTGGASGLGEATVRLLVAHGALCPILDINVERGKTLEREASLKGRTHFVEVDVTSEEDVRKAIEEVDKLGGEWKGKKVAGVVNCGGAAVAGKILDKDGEPFDLSTFARVMEINTVGTFNVSRLIAARILQDHPGSLKERLPVDTYVPDRGVIVNVASLAALEGQEGQVAYAASKAGVVGMTLPMARDLSRYGIRVMTICPGAFETTMTRHMSQKARESIVRTFIFPTRFGDADEFAHLTLSVFENQMLNGSIIRLDGATRLGGKL